MYGRKSHSLGGKSNTECNGTDGTCGTHKVKTNKDQDTYISALLKCAKCLAFCCSCKRIAEAPGEFLINVLGHCLIPSTKGVGYLKLGNENEFKAWLASDLQQKMQPAYIRSILQAVSMPRLPKPSAHMEAEAMAYLDAVDAA